MDEIIKIGEEFFKILRKEWDVLLVLIIIGLAWNFNLLKELLFIFGVAILGRMLWLFGCIIYSKILYRVLIL